MLKEWIIRIFEYGKMKGFKLHGAAFDNEGKFAKLEREGRTPVRQGQKILTPRGLSDLCGTRFRFSENITQDLDLPWHHQ